MLFKNRFPNLQVGDYQEIGTPEHILQQLPADVKVRSFATPSQSNPNDGYLLQIIKNKRAGWANGTAFIACICVDGLFKTGLLMSGVKAPCKHGELLRQLLKSGSTAVVPV